MKFSYRRVYVESLGYVLPGEQITSDEIETRLTPLYERLRLPKGRLELMSGIATRRLWPRGQRPSAMSIRSGQHALAAGSVDLRHVGALIHGSVCRDYLEPATACGVHHALALPAECLVYDVSNACLGLLNGVLQIANLIELGQIRAGLVVGTEDSRPLLETTIAALNANEQLTRDQVKLAIASLTIGSASSAILLTDPELSTTGNRLLGGVCHTATHHHELCQGGDGDTLGSGHAPLMQTDSERLMQAGIEAAAVAFDQLCELLDWSPATLDRTCCHQVGAAHRKLLCQRLAIDPARDFVTFPWLGNTGSVALPVTLARALEAGAIGPGHDVALLGIGSGINVVMLGLHVEQARLRGEDLFDRSAAAAQ